MADDMNGFSRRQFLNAAANMAALAVMRPALAQPSPMAARLSANPFIFGVASGDPLPDAVVLWTRLGLDIADPETWGLSEPSYKLLWAVHEIDGPRQPAAFGEAIAAREKGYAVHIEATGLKPGRAYRYRFWCGDEESATGLTRTAPDAAMASGRLRFGFCSCSEYENAYFHAYRAMAEDKLDFAVHLGDYIYEQPYEHFRVKFGAASARRLRFDRYSSALEPVRIETLQQFRRRYAEYRLDQDLQEAHRVMPWIVTWDDHEVDNDYAGLKPLSGDAAAFLQKRTNAYQAYFENMPIRLSALPVVNGARQLYRSFDFGKLMRLHVLDERQYRDEQACKPDKFVDVAACPDYRKERQMLGQQQFDWFAGNLANSPALWNVIAQGVIFTPLLSNKVENEPEKVWHDAWAGYPWAQENVVKLLAQNRGKNPVFISGDIHSHWVTRIMHAEPGKPAEVIAPEFTCSSISSFTNDMPEVAWRNRDKVIFHNGKANGYVAVDVSGDAAEPSSAEIKATMVMMVPEKTQPAWTHVPDTNWTFRVTPAQPDPRRV